MTVDSSPGSPVLAAVRAATGDDHRRLDGRSNVVARLADSHQRADVIGRYAAFHLPAEIELAPHLVAVDGLAFETRRRVALQPFAPSSAPSFPAAHNIARALGLLYVLEGSTLGGRMILRALRARGIDDPALAFLDPYGARTGEMWRGFLAVFAREVGDDPAAIAQARDGASDGFRHVERILCGP